MQQNYAKTLRLLIIPFILLCSVALFAAPLWEESYYSTYPTHKHIFEGHSTKEEAHTACELFATSHGSNPDDVCVLGWTYLNGVGTGIWAAGYLRDPQPGDKCFYYGFFYYHTPVFYVSTPLYSSKCGGEGNPCVPATGEKLQDETDYAQASGELTFSRLYRSQNISANRGGMGVNWSHSFAKRMDFYPRRDDTALNPQITKSGIYNSPEAACSQGWEDIRTMAYRGLVSGATAGGYQSGLCNIILDPEHTLSLEVHMTHGMGFMASVLIHIIEHESGRRYIFREEGGLWRETTGLPVQLALDGNEWVFVDQGGNEERYGGDGLLISSKRLGRERIDYTYNENSLLATVSDQFGHSLTFSYNPSGQLATLTTPDGDITYSYDGIGNLTGVSYPDGSGKTYHYEDANFPHHLTGISDENGKRYATWSYDSAGRAIVSEHANGAERVEFTYNTDATTTVKQIVSDDPNNPIEAERTYHFTVQQGGLKVDHIEGDRCVDCSQGDTQAYLYDSNGFVIQRTDWNGNVTAYTRDAEGRELSRTEGFGTPEARTIATTWNTDLNKPLTVTEPQRITTYTYDSVGRLASEKQETAP